MPHEAVHRLWSLSFHLHEFHDLWSYEFMRSALAAAALLSLLGGYLAVFVVLRRIVFVTVAIAEFSACGIALALLVGAAHAAVLNYSMGAGLAGVLLLALVSGGRRLTKESVVGTTYAGAAAVSVLMLAVAGKHEGHDLSALMWGDVLALSRHNVVELLLVFAAVGVFHVLFYKEFLFCSFDPVMARSVGLPVRLYDLLFFALLGAAIALAMHTVGLLVVFAYLVVPGVIGLLVARTMSGAFVASVVAGLAASAIGVHLSWVLDVPTGLTLVATLVALTPVAAIVCLVRNRRTGR